MTAPQQNEVSIVRALGMGRPARQRRRRLQDAHATVQLPKGLTDGRFETQVSDAAPQAPAISVRRAQINELRCPKQMELLARLLLLAGLSSGTAWLTTRAVSLWLIASDAGGSETTWVRYYTGDIDWRSLCAPLRLKLPREEDLLQRWDSVFRYASAEALLAGDWP